MRRRIPAYDPGTLHAEVPRQPTLEGPLAAFVLQKPRTASSGRSGKRFASGFSYFFLLVLVCCIDLPLTSDGACNRTTTTTARTASGGSRLQRFIWNRRDPFRFTGLQRLGGGRDEVVTRTAGAVFAIAVRANRDIERLRTEMRNLTEKVDGRFGIAVFQLPVRGAHAAHRL
jgi:hypothetical protein